MAAVLIAATVPLGLAAPQIAGAAPARTAAHAATSITADQIPDPDPFTGLEPDITARPMCATSSPNKCAWDQSPGNGDYIYDHVQAAGARENMKFNANGNNFTWNGHTYHVGTLNMPGESPACLGTPSAFKIIQLANCSTGQGTIWGHGTSNGHDVWVNRYWTQITNSLKVLASTQGCFCGDGPLAADDWYDPALYRRWSF